MAVSTAMAPMVGISDTGSTTTDIANAPVTELPPVVVSATRSEQPNTASAAAIQVIRREDIEASAATTVTDVLRGFSGIQVVDLFGDGSSTQIGMRGFSENANSNTLVLVDGRRLNYSDSRSPDINFIPLHDIDRIEISEGSSGALFGDQAVGGVINIITSKPKKTQLQVEVSNGSYARQGYAANLSGRSELDFNYKFSANDQTSDNYRQHNQATQYTRTAYLEQTGQNGSAFVELQETTTTLQLPGALLTQEFASDPTQFHPSFAADYSNLDSRVHRVGVKQTITDIWSIEAEQTEQTVEGDLRQSFRDLASPETGNSQRHLRSLNPRILAAVPVGQRNMLLTIGVDKESSEFDLYLPYVYRDYETNELVPGFVRQGNQQNVTSHFLHAIIPASDTFSLTVGARKARMVNSIDDQSSYRAANYALAVEDSVSVLEIGVRFDFSHDRSLTVRKDENYRFAKTDEFLNTSDRILDTQEGVSREIQYQDKLGEKLDIKLQLYRIDLKNEFFYDPSVGTFGENVNLDKTLHKGASLTIKKSFNQGNHVSMYYGTTDAKFKSGGLSGKNISGVSRNQLSIKLKHRIDPHWGIYSEYEYRGKKFAQGDNVNALGELGGYSLINIAGTFEVKNFIANVRFNNAFDKKYSEFVTSRGDPIAYQPSPDRNFFVSAGYKF